MKTNPTFNQLGAALVALAAFTAGAPRLTASSHQDAPLIVLDPAANTTDVYAFRSNTGNEKYLTVALAVYPFEEPGIGPNKYNFDDNVLYKIWVGTGKDLAAGKSTVAYEFRFKTVYKNTNTIAQSYLGVINNVDDANQNLTQHYTVTKFSRTTGARGQVLFPGVDLLVPPNNQGLVTKFYNQGDNGNNKAKEGVATTAALDKYTAETSYTQASGPSYQVFAGQRDDGFYADIHSIFDLDFTFTGGNKPHDSQGGFNVHTIVLNIPVAELGGDQQVAGVYATTSRQRVRILKQVNEGTEQGGVQNASGFIQVGRQGNPLFCEGLVSIRDKDRYNQIPPDDDAEVFKNYALNPELATLLNAPVNLRTNRTDLAGIFIPDMIKIDLSTGPARLAGGSNAGAAPNDAGFNRLGIFGGGMNMAGGTANPDVLQSTIGQGFLGQGVQPGGWPNGRRFGDDVVDIAVLAIFSDLRNPMAPTLAKAPADPGVDKVDHNDIGYNKVFPYAATPHNGRNNVHP